MERYSGEMELGAKGNNAGLNSCVFLCNLSGITYVFTITPLSGSVSNVQTNES